MMNDPLSGERPISGEPLGSEKFIEQISELSDLNRRLRRKIFDLYTVFEISRHLSSMLDTETLIDAILLTCLGQMGVDSAVILITDAASGHLVHPHAKGIDVSALKEIKLKLSDHIIDIFVKNGKPLTAFELRQLLKDKESDLGNLEFFNFELAAPLIMKNRLLGLLFLPSKISGAQFYDSDIEFLSLLMNQLSVAIENSNLYAREKSAREELLRTQKLLVSSERMAALGKLSASIAHEVNNPLAIISNYLHILSIQKLPEDVFNNYIKILREEVKRIAGIVKQLLDFYRPQQEEVDDVDIKKVVAETLTLLSHQLSNANINVRVKADKNIPLILGSAEKLKQVFLNLLMNSKDFLPAGGIIEIKIMNSGENVEIKLSDDGPGIPEDLLNKIFEPFFTTKGEQGTGLGLAVCYGIIQWHKGTITASNNHRGGATFTITLPAKKDDR